MFDTLPQPLAFLVKITSISHDCFMLNIYDLLITNRRLYAILGSTFHQYGKDNYLNNLINNKSMFIENKNVGGQIYYLTEGY